MLTCPAPYHVPSESRSVPEGCELCSDWLHYRRGGICLEPWETVWISMLGNNSSCYWGVQLEIHDNLFFRGASVWLNLSSFVNHQKITMWWMSPTLSKPTFCKSHFLKHSRHLIKLWKVSFQQKKHQKSSLSQMNFYHNLFPKIHWGSTSNCNYVAFHEEISMHVVMRCCQKTSKMQCCCEFWRI